MSDRALKGLAAGSAVALMIVVAGGVVTGTSATADTLRPGVDRALTAGGYDDVEATVSGREVTVAGGTADELRAAIALVERVPGVRSASIATTRGAVEQIDTSRPYLRLRRDGDRLRVIGAVRDAGSAAALKVAAARAFGLEVRGDLVVDPDLPAAPWTTELPTVLDQLVGIPGLQVVVDGDTLAVAGDPDPVADGDTMLDALRRGVPSLRLRSTIGQAP